MKKNYLTKAVIAIAAMIFAFSGCKKDNNHPSTNTKNIGSSGAIPDGYTMTSVGLLPNANITLIEDGYKLSFINGHAFKVHIATGSRVKDLGEVMPNIATKNPASNVMPVHSAFVHPSTAAAIFGNSGQANNWVTFSQWTSANPITSYNTTWTVPAAPTGNTGETFAIWTGLEPASEAYPLIQPLLIWGNSGGTIGGGQYWTIVSYIIWQNSSGVTLAAISTVKHNIAVGTVLQAEITCSSQQPDGSYNCVSQFVGQTSLTITENASLNVNGGGTAPAPFIPALDYACEVLEIPGAPYITSVNEYPNQSDVSMNSISIATGSTHPTVSWQSSSTNGLPNGATLGEHTDIINSATVNIFFKPEPASVFTYYTPVAFTINQPITALNPSVSSGTPISWAISPALPAGLSISTTTGVISGTPTVLSAAKNYTVTATGPGGTTGTFVINLAIVNGAMTFICSTGSGPSIYFDLTVNGGPQSGTVRIGSGQSSYTVTLPCTVNTNSTVIVTFPTGAPPAGGAIYGFGAPIYATTVGTTLTFTGVNLTAGTSCNLVMN